MWYLPEMRYRSSLNYLKPYTLAFIEEVLEAISH
jgi:hypothetical protein